MSFKFLAWAQSYKTGAPSTKAVLMALCSICNDEGVCWPNQKRLADDAELSEKTVWSCLQRLEDAGLITRERRATSFGHRISDLITVHQTPKTLPVNSTVTDDSLTVTVSEPNRNSYDAEPVNEPVSSSVRGETPKKRPSAMPHDFWPNPEVEKVAISFGFSHHDIRSEIQSMRDWAVNAGPKGKKLDWNAFARNWFKSNAQKMKGSTYAKSSKPSRADEWDAATSRVKARRGIPDAETGYDIDGDFQRID